MLFEQTYSCTKTDLPFDSVTFLKTLSNAFLRQRPLTLFVWLVMCTVKFNHLSILVYYYLKYGIGKRNNLKPISNQIFEKCLKIPNTFFNGHRFKIRLQVHNNYFYSCTSQTTRVFIQSFISSNCDSSTHELNKNAIFRMFCDLVLIFKSIFFFYYFFMFFDYFYTFETIW